jgi:hypothetical protein
MGLEIFYDLHAPADWPNARVQDVVEKVHDLSLVLGFAEVDPVLPNDPDESKTLLVKDASDVALLLPRVSSTEGWFFRAWPGEGCETALFGLCYFPRIVTVNGVEMATGWGEGWHFHTWCKTQYADRVSREHFLKCHRGVIAILDAFHANGVEVNARDGSGYWEHRDDAKLLEQLDDWNRIVAATAGATRTQSRILQKRSCRRSSARPTSSIWNLKVTRSCAANARKRMVDEQKDRLAAHARTREA